MWKKLLCIITAAAVQLSFGALDWNITGSGARAAGMGNAFIGLADDATAINWNPGGLTALEHFEASVVGGAVLDKEVYTFSDNNGWNYEDEITYSRAYLSFLSMAYPMKIGEKKLVLAASLQKQLDFFSEDSWENDTENYEYNSEGGVYTANIGAAYQVLPYLSIGTTANIWTGSSNSEEEYVDNDYGYEYTSYDEFSSFKGFNVSIGTIFDYSAIKENIPLKIGAVVKTPFDLKADYYFEENDTYDNYWDYNSEVTIEMPFMFGIGASYRFGDFFTMSVDFEKRNYAKSKVIEESERDGTYEYYLSDNEKDVTQFRFGMEYLLVTDNLVIPIRAGIFNYPTLWSNIDTDYEYNSSSGEYEPVLYTYEQLTGYGFSLGTGLIFESFAFDVSYNFVTYTNESNETYSGGAFDGYATETAWENSKSALNLSAILYLDSFTK